MTEHKLADKLQISVEEAKDLINKYFTVFPNIHKFLNNLANYGLVNGHIKTFSPYKRIRWFPDWTSKLANSNIWTLNKYERKLRGSIERESKNTPIQGSGSNITKLAMKYIRNYINDNNLQDKVKMVLQIHDDIVTEVKENYAEEWKSIQEKLMIKASKEIITEFTMGVDAAINKVWNK